MSFIHLQLEFVLITIGFGSVLPEVDPRIRIRIKMKRIRNTDLRPQIQVSAVLGQYKIYDGT